jgi:(p)ppGpp synthase/HD superfamily hydrolase
MELLRLGCDKDTIVAGILHDTLEDTHLERGFIKREFGEKVLSLIEPVTKPKDSNMTKEGKRRTWESRKNAYLGQLKSAPVEARAIACVDMWANMLELKKTIEEEGPDALKLFNVDMERKLKHWENEIQLFTSDTGSLYLSLISELRNILLESTVFKAKNQLSNQP